jgi:type IV secretion system protein VirB9
MKKLYNIINLALVAFVLSCYAQVAAAAVPITTDSRIKTLVYNENEVFHLTLHYGYQSNIEFAIGEEIDTLSIGNSSSWKITPIDRRLFIKPLEGSAKTNMTVITNKRTYQFELESKDPDQNLDEELVYVVRFFYPSDSFDNPLPKIDDKKFAPEPIKKMPEIAAKSPSTLADAGSSSNNFNFNYTITGPDNIAPLKVFDDGERTFFKFPNNNATIPSLFVVDDKKVETRVSFARQGEYIVVKKIFKKMALKLGKDVVYVYNETNKQADK